MKVILPLRPIAIRPKSSEGKAISEDKAAEVLDLVTIPCTPMGHLVIYITFDTQLPIPDRITLHLFGQNSSGSAERSFLLAGYPDDHYRDLEEQRKRVFELPFTHDSIETNWSGLGITYVCVTSDDIYTELSAEVEIVHSFVYMVKSNFFRRQFRYLDNKRHHEVGEMFSFENLELVVMEVDDVAGVATCAAYKA